MPTLKERDQQLIYRHRSLTAPAVACGGVIFGGFLLFSVDAGLLLALFSILFFAWMAVSIHDSSEFHFNGSVRTITGWCRRFPLKTDSFCIPLEDIQGVTVETSCGDAYRITLVTATGSVSLTRTYHSDDAVLEDANRIHEWFRRHDVVVPTKLA